MYKIDCLVGAGVFGCTWHCDLPAVDLWHDLRPIMSDSVETHALRMYISMEVYSACADSDFSLSGSALLNDEISEQYFQQAYERHSISVECKTTTEKLSLSKIMWLELEHCVVPLFGDGCPALAPPSSHHRTFLFTRVNLGCGSASPTPTP